MKAEIEYLVDEQGNRTKVLLPVEVYEAIMERMEDEDIAEVARQSRGEVGRPLAEFMAELQAEGELD